MKRNPRQRVLWIFGILAIGCPCFLCAFGFSLLQSWFGTAANDLDRELAAAKKEHLPLEPADLRPKIPTPEDQNAAAIYRVFFPVVDRLYARTRDLRLIVRKVLRDEATPEEAALAKQALDGDTELFSELTAASKRPYCDFNYRYERGFELQMPQLGRGREAAQLLCARAVLSDDLSSSLADLATAQRIGAHLGQTPLPIGFMLNSGIDDSVMRALSRLIERVSENPASLEEVANFIRSLQPLPSFRPAMRGELVMGRITIQQIRNLNDMESVGVANNEGRLSLPIPPSIRRAFETRFVALWRKIFARLPSTEGDWKNEYEVLRQIRTEVLKDSSPSNYLNQRFFMIFDTMPLLNGHNLAFQRLLLVAIRIYQERLSTHHFPEKLPALGADGLDPFDGKPLRYRTTERGFTLYSIDRDFKDNGGIRSTPGQPGFDLILDFK